MGKPKSKAKSKQRAKSKRRPFEFDRATQARIAARQQYLCAACGKQLGTGNVGTLVNYHHVIPVVAGTEGDAGDAFLQSSDNGVMLCDLLANGEKANCHFGVAHGDGRYAGFVALPNDFPFSHGRDRAAHVAWAAAWMAKRPSRWRRFESE